MFVYQTDQTNFYKSKNSQLNLMVG